MALINLKTDLKSLKYGRDTLDGGDSKQPLVKTSIPDSFAEIGNTGGFDSTLRGGALIGTALANDTLRINKLLNTAGTFQGATFKTKMNLLSNTNVKTQVDTQKYNQGEYQTRNTLAQVATDPFGTRFELFSGNLRYFDAIKNQQIGDNPSGRLVDFYNTKITPRTEGTELYSYDGGPGANLGFGKTVINLAGDRTGRNNPKLLKFYGRPGERNPLYDLLNSGDLLIGNETPGAAEPEFLVNPITALGFQAFERKKITALNTAVWASGVTNLLYNPADNQASGILKTGYQQATLESKLPSNSQGVLSDPKQILDQANKGVPYLMTGNAIQEITNADLYRTSNKLTDFRRDVEDKSTKLVSLTRKLKSGTYNDSVRKTVLGDPGSKQKDYARETTENNIGSNQVNLQPLYLSKDFGKTIDGSKDSAKEDPFVRFKIGILSNDTLDGYSATWVSLPAYIDSFNDAYTGNWSDYSLLGRGERFYSYNGFNREITLSFTTHAQSLAERDVMYSKLNYLASSLAPDYAGTGIMKGNFAVLQIGNYLPTQTFGILKSMTFDIPNNSPWDIDAQMPHMIKVTGVSFTPIHNFIPQIGKSFIYPSGIEEYKPKPTAPAKDEAKTQQSQQEPSTGQPAQETDGTSSENPDKIKEVVIKVKRKQNKELGKLRRLAKQGQIQGRDLQVIETAGLQPLPTTPINFDR
jgi:hypothetical protein